MAAIPVNQAASLRVRVRARYKGNKCIPELIAMLRDRGSENEDEPGVTTVKDSPLVLLREGNTGRDTLLFSDPATRTRRLVVPTTELRREVLEMAHDNATHQGLLHPYGRASKGFYWRGMVRLIKEYIAHCRPCQETRIWLTDRTPSCG